MEIQKINKKLYLSQSKYFGLSNIYTYAYIDFYNENKFKIYDAHPLFSDDQISKKYGISFESHCSDDGECGERDIGGGHAQILKFLTSLNDRSYKLYAACERQVPLRQPKISSRIPQDNQPRPQKLIEGTGFAVADARLLTNAHVVKGCNQVSIAHEGTVVGGIVIARDKTNDLALIKADLSLQPAPLRAGVRLGENVSVFGFPLAGLLASNGNFTRGNITATAGLGDDSRYLQISAPVQPGNSGGPLLDESGNVVGIVTAKINALLTAALIKDVPQNVNFAIKTGIIQTFLQSQGVPYQGKTETKPLSPADIAQRAQQFTVLIVCKTSG